MRRLWLVFLVLGVVLFIILDLVMRNSNSTKLLPALLFAGAFTVPITFVAFFYEHVRDRDISIPLLTTCFGVGGALGLVAAGVIEFNTLRTLDVGAMASKRIC